MTNKRKHYNILGFTGYFILLYIIWNAPLWLFFIICFSYWIIWKGIFEKLYGSLDEDDVDET